MPKSMDSALKALREGGSGQRHMMQGPAHDWPLVVKTAACRLYLLCWIFTGWGVCGGVLLVPGRVGIVLS